jgi:hypothetical protein
MGAELAVVHRIDWKSGCRCRRHVLDLCRQNGNSSTYAFYYEYDFEILDKDGYLLCYSSFDLGMTFNTYDQCFRAARKWIRDNQNLVYGENNV